MSAPIAKALAAIGRGEAVIVTDDQERENEGDLIMAADAATTESLAFLLEHTSGVTPDRRAMARRPELEALALSNGLPMVSIAELRRHRLRTERLIRQVAEAPVPTRHGTFTCQAWWSELDGADHLALVMGEPSGGDPVLVRVHSECLTGDVFGSRRCDC